MLVRLTLFCADTIHVNYGSDSYRTYVTPSLTFGQLRSDACRYFERSARLYLLHDGAGTVYTSKERVMNSIDQLLPSSASVSGAVPHAGSNSVLSHLISKRRLKAFRRMMSPSAGVYHYI